MPSFVATFGASSEDGFHLPLSSLRSRPDATEAIYRRGALDTFDPDALREKLLQVLEGNEASVKFPDFDHASWHLNRYKCMISIFLCWGMFKWDDEIMGFLA